MGEFFRDVQPLCSQLTWFPCRPFSAHQCANDCQELLAQALALGMSFSPLQASGGNHLTTSMLEPAIPSVSARHSLPASSTWLLWGAQSLAGLA